jgi:hypothetical protein
MRVKVNLTREDFPKKLEFGKSYWFGYRGSSLSEEFVFTRKKKVELRNSWDNKRNFMTKKELKKMFTKDEWAIQFLTEFEKK